MDDVASRAKVSKATVSRVLSGKQLVSNDVRDKVIAACKELNYKLNFNIQDFVLKSRNGATRNIALIMVNKSFSDQAYAYLLDELSDAINKFNYNLMLATLTGKEEDIYELPHILRDNRVDGILLTGAVTPSSISLIKKLNLKCVLVGNYSEKLVNSLSNVQLKIDVKVFDLIKKLADKGNKRIAFIEESPDNYSANKIYRAYRDALSDLGLPFDDEICYLGNGPFTGMFDILKPVFYKNILPFDSIFCPDLRISREITHLLMGHFGLWHKIDIMLATFWASNNEIPLIPVIYADNSFGRLAKPAMELLINQIENKEEPKTIFLD